MRFGVGMRAVTLLALCACGAPGIEWTHTVVGEYAEREQPAKMLPIDTRPDSHEYELIGEMSMHGPDDFKAIAAYAAELGADIYVPKTWGRAGEETSTGFGYVIVGNGSASNPEYNSPGESTTYSLYRGTFQLWRRRKP